MNAIHARSQLRYWPTFGEEKLTFNNNAVLVSPRLEKSRGHLGQVLPPERLHVTHVGHFLLARSEAPPNGMVEESRYESDRERRRRDRNMPAASAVSVKVSVAGSGTSVVERWVQAPATSSVGEVETTPESHSSSERRCGVKKFQ